MKSSRIMKIFEQYVRKYDMNNINIKARYFHSLKVMEIVKDLATELGIFTEEEIAVCELIGLFHEIGNFSSTPNYHIDEDNEDSSNKAIDVLFNKGLIREISKDKTYDNVIKIALFAYDKNGFHVKLNAPRFSEEALKKNQVVVDLVNKIAKEKKAIVAQISLAWVLAQKDFIVPIPGTTKLERLKENIKATEIKFTKAEVESMNEALSQMDIESRRFEPDSDFEKRVDL